MEWDVWDHLEDRGNCTACDQHWGNPFRAKRLGRPREREQTIYICRRCRGTRKIEDEGWLPRHNTVDFEMSLVESLAASQLLLMGIGRADQAFRLLTTTKIAVQYAEVESPVVKINRETSFTPLVEAYRALARYDCRVAEDDCSGCDHEFLDEYCLGSGCEFGSALEHGLMDRLELFLKERAQFYRVFADLYLSLFQLEPSLAERRDQETIREFLKGRLAWVATRQPGIVELSERLLAIGGKYIVPRSEPDLEDLLESGQLMDLPVEMHEMAPNQCHRNARRYVERHGGTIATGWALSRDKWRQHSWVIEGDHIVETTYRFELYYGIIHTGGTERDTEERQESE